MSLEVVKTIIRLLGGALAYFTLGLIFNGIWKGTRRPVGQITGHMGGTLRSPWFYLLTSALFFGISFLGWKPIPLNVPQPVHFWALVVGALFYFPGMALALWGRIVLGLNYFVSTGYSAQLFADQALITHGPFAYLRHPMYAGIILAAAGSLLIYHTWTTILFAFFAPALYFRARREETALAAEFGEQWSDYCRRVPAFLPRIVIRRD